MIINARTSKWMHRTLFTEELSEFVTLRRRQANKPANQWVQERWRAVQLDTTEETEPTGASYITVLTRHWYLMKENPEYDAPNIGDQLVEKDGTVTELNSMVPVVHAIFRDYMFEVVGAVQGVN